MTPTEEEKFHHEFSTNVRALESARKKVNSQINMFLRKDDDFSVYLYTKIYALLYFAWTEANLVKLVHTPYGFDLAEKKFILKDRDVIVKWKRCISTAFKKFKIEGSDIPNKKLQINRLIKNYLDTQAKIRNKVAHGQWINPLFSNNLSFDPDIKIQMELITVIEIDLWFEIAKELIEIVRGLIDAKHRNNLIAHYNEYYTRLSSIQNIIDERKKWTIDEKKRKLKLKPIKQIKE